MIKTIGQFQIVFCFFFLYLHHITRVNLKQYTIWGLFHSVLLHNSYLESYVTTATNNIKQEIRVEITNKIIKSCFNDVIYSYGTL